MISDVLSETNSEITRYRKQFPSVYEEYKDQLDAVQQVIEDMRVVLDTPSLNADRVDFVQETQ